MKKRISKRGYTGYMLGGIVLGIVVFVGLLVFRVIKMPQKEEVSQLSQENVEAIKSSPETSVTLTKTQIESLYDMYVREEDTDIARSLLQYYLSVGDYTGGYTLLETIEKKGHLDKMYKPTIAFLLFNHAIDSRIRWEQVDYKRRGIDGDSKSFHDTLPTLLRTDFTGFVAQITELGKTNVLYKNLIDTLLSSVQTFSSLKDPPAHYKEGLIAATLMEAGYMPLAGMLATNILRVDKKYILSYEILSQKALKQRDYDEAIKYLQILFNLDTQHISRTAFYLGKAYFRKQDYSNALVYLNQVADQKYLYDAIRYMILTYHEQGNTDRMMDGFRYLLVERKLTPNDYLLLYDFVFFEPYLQNRVVSGTGTKQVAQITRENSLKVIIPYIDSCRKNIAKVAPYVCKYGEAGWYLSQNRPEKALENLLSLTKTYPHPTVFKALGDYYTMQGESEKAQTYFMKSLVTSADTY